MSNLFELKAYLMSGFVNQKHKNYSLIEIYALDHKYFLSLEKQNKIKEDAITFFREKGNEVLEAIKIPTAAFRNLKYQMIIDEYLESSRNKSGDLEKENIEEKNIFSRNETTDSSVASKKRTDTTNNNKIKKSVVFNEPKMSEEQLKRPLHCPRDMRTLELFSVKEATVARTGKTLIFPKYHCPKCRRKYTVLQGYVDGRWIKLDNVEYINLEPQYNENRYRSYIKKPHPIPAGNRCYVYDIKKPKKCRNCQEADFIETSIQYKDKKMVTRLYQVLYCINCNSYYLEYKTYRNHRKDWKLVNRDDLTAIKDDIRRREEDRERSTKEKARMYAQQENMRRQNEKLQKSQESLKEKQSTVPKITQITAKESIQRQNNTINVKDFVVRRTTFKCRHNDHKLQNIDAIIKIIDRNGDIVETRVSAGYCPNCNVYFIMESTYQNLKTRGTPICRVSDEKAYLSNSAFFNGTQLAQESILKQYGYSVSQEEGLTRARRQKILALLVDNKVLTRSEIISYLDFFINQRKHQYRYEKAIDKWESDREFISEYKSGVYSQYGVKAIYRKY